MADEQQTNPPAGAQNTEAHEERIPYSRFKEVNDEKKALEARLAKLERAQSEADQKRLEDEKRYQELADKYKAELDQVRPVAGQVDDYKAALKETAAAQIALLPEDVRDLVPEYPDPRDTLTWLNKNAAKLKRPLAPDMDAGVRGDSAKPAIKLTPGEEKALRMSHMKREDYIAAKIAMEARRLTDDKE